jgi:hypothetical protein
MRAAEIVGGVAVVGVAALLGLSLLDDDEPAAFQTEDSLGLVPAAESGGNSTTSSSTITSTGVTVSVTTEPPTVSNGPTTESAPDTTVTATTTRSTPTTRPVTTTTAASSASPTLPEDDRGAIAVRVLNAGVEAGAASFVTGVLRQSGFEPLDPRDAPTEVDATTVLFAPGREAEAATVNSVIDADPDNVMPTPDGDASWEEFGGELDVLVLLGPS